VALRYVDILLSQINCDDDYENNLQQMMNRKYPSQDISVHKIQDK